MMSTVLIIEDSAPVRARIAGHLEAEGFQVLQATTAAEGTERVRAHLPDVILCDLALPDRGGTELLKDLRDDDSLPFIPAIVVSVRRQTAQIVEALAFAEEYLVKPVNLVELQARVRSMLRLSRTHKELQRLNSNLEGRVRERTLALEVANEALREEVELRTRSEVKVRRLSKRFIDMREKERAELALDIHDVLGTSLLTLKLLVKTAWRRLDPQGDHSEALLEIVTLLSDTTERARNLSKALGPLALESFGLSGALNGLLETYRRAHPGVRVRLSLPRTEPQLDAAARIHIFRIAQEALANAFRHAQAKEVGVSVRFGDLTELVVIDDGQGFEIETPRPGIGLLIMQHRAETIGANLMVTSVPGTGTCVHLTLASMPEANQEGGNGDGSRISQDA